LSEIDKLSHIKKLIENEIRQLLLPMEPVSLYRPMRYTIAAGGKRLRPVLLLLSCEAVGGNIHDSLPAAAAVELLHNFTLVHDDIMDQDDKRRGRETVHKKWNENVAILAGDGLLALAYDSLMKIRCPQVQRIGRIFSEALLKVCEGQALDSEFESRQMVSLDEYFNMIQKKTARLFAMSCEIGAICGSGNEAQIEHLRKLGELLGTAFQIQDDLLDITISEETLGKSYGSDVKQGKKTFLIIHAFAHASDHEKAKIETILHSSTTGSKEVQQMKGLFEKLGSLQAAKTEIENALISARACLDHLPKSSAQSTLFNLLNTVAKRDF